MPVAERSGKPGLVEMSSHNIRASQTLLRLFPEARFIHALRDGRDSAASVTGKTWGPRRVGAAIGWWADRLRSIEERDPRQRGRRRLLDLRPTASGSSCSRTSSASSDGTHLRRPARVPRSRRRGRRSATFFDAEMTPETAHLGRWRRQLSAPGRLWVQRRYEWTVGALEREGNHAAPVLRAALDREAAAGAVDEPARGRARPAGPPRILFATSNGTGLGHLNRAMAIARRLPDDHESSFFTLSGAAPVVAARGLPRSITWPPIGARRRAPTAPGTCVCGRCSSRSSPSARPTSSSSTASIPTAP